MTEGTRLRQIDLFTAKAAPRGAELDLAEALATARRALAEAGSRNDDGGSRGIRAHLPKSPGGPEIYALCPGCEVHPGGGIFPAAELARAEGCPTGAHLPAKDNAFTEGEGRRRAEREGSARSGPEERKAFSRFSPSAFPLGFSLTGSRGLCSGLRGSSIMAMAARLSPRRLLAEGGRRLRRGWYFHRRRAICRQRLSRIASDPSWTS